MLMACSSSSDTSTPFGYRLPSDAVGRDLAEFRDLEVVHAHRLRIAFAAQLTAVVLEIPNQLLLFRVHRDRRLARGDRRLHRRVDVLELGISVRVVTALPRLAIGLAAVVQLPQQLADHALADLEALGGQRLDEVALAAADPAQWRSGIAANRPLD